LQAPTAETVGSCQRSTVAGRQCRHRRQQE
jgi:hypothetical protein